MKNTGLGNTWKHLKLHKKPIVLLDIDGCWKNLATLIDDVVQAGFANVGAGDLFTIANNVEDVFVALDKAPESS